MPFDYIVVPVRIKMPGLPQLTPAPPFFELEKRLVADTGSPVTLVPHSNFGPFWERANIRLGPMLMTAGLAGTGGVVVFRLLGATMEVEVEDYGGGNRETRSCHTMYAHMGEDGSFAEGSDGVLGNDQFRNLRAGPVVSEDGEHEYLAKRAPYRESR